MNRIRLFSSGALFLFAVYCVILNPELPFSQPDWVYVVATVFLCRISHKGYACAVHE